MIIAVSPISGVIHYDEDDKPIFENLIHDAIIARADSVKRPSAAVRDG
jgi:hypothetical protein